MKRFLLIAAACALASCVATPQIAPAGQFQSEADFSVTLPSDWSQWPSQINYATQGEFLTKDGVFLNRLHFVTLDDGGSLLRAARNAEVPRYSAGASELEIVDMLTSSLERIGYNSVEADNIRPATFDGVDGLRFGISGRWENGLNVRGDVAAVREGDQLNLILFLAPEMHYYGRLAEEVDTIMSSMDLAAE